MRTMAALLVATLDVWPFWYLFYRAQKGKRIEGCLSVMALVVVLFIAGIAMSLGFEAHAVAVRNRFVEGRNCSHLVKAVFRRRAFGSQAGKLVIARPRSLAFLEDAIRGAQQGTLPGPEGGAYQAAFYLSSGSCVEMNVTFSQRPRNVIEITTLSTYGLMHMRYYLVKLPSKMPASLAKAMRLLECGCGWASAQGHAF